MEHPGAAFSLSQGRLNPHRNPADLQKAGFFASFMPQGPSPAPGRGSFHPRGWGTPPSAGSPSPHKRRWCGHIPGSGRLPPFSPAKEAILPTLHGLSGPPSVLFRCPAGATLAGRPYNESPPLPGWFGLSSQSPPVDPPRKPPIRAAPGTGQWMPGCSPAGQTSPARLKEPLRRSPPGGFPLSQKRSLYP